MESTTKGKHDLQLQQELNQVFTSKGITATSSFERKRGKLCLSVKGDMYFEASAVVDQLHPDFKYDYADHKNGTDFIYFRQIFNAH